MRSFSGRGKVLALALCLLVLVPGLARSSEALPTLKVVVNAAPPYRIIEKEEYATLISGIYVDVMREAASRAGFKLKFVIASFIQALSMMETGAVDVMLGPNRLPDRERYMHFLEPALPAEPKVVLLAADASDVADLVELAGKRVGVLPGASYGPAFDAADAFEKVPLRSYVDGMGMVANTYLDAVVVPEQLGDYLMLKTELTLKKATLRMPGRPSYIAWSNLSPVLDLKGKLQAALKTVLEDGTFERILASYR